MSPSIGRLFSLVLLSVVAASCTRGQDDAYVQEIDAWHAGRLERLRSETGWLTLVGLHPLRAGISTLGSAAGMDVRLNVQATGRLGTIAVANGEITFVAHSGAQVWVTGQEDRGPVDTLKLESDASGSPTTLETGSLRFYVIERGGRFFLRVKDRRSALRQHFTGIERFPVRKRWCTIARLEPHDPPRTIAVANVLGQTDESSSPGTLIFELDGRTCRLCPLGEAGQSLFIIFSDESNGQTTYGGGRFLSAEAPGPDGTVILDFNKATNPPCAFTPYATCPLPPEGNTLPLAVHAGEKIWRKPH